MPDTCDVVVLLSGTGSNLQALIDSTRTGESPVRIAAVISNRADAYGKRGMVRLKLGRDREAFLDLREAMRRNPNLKEQVYLNPHPKELMLLNRV